MTMEQQRHFKKTMGYKMLIHLAKFDYVSNKKCSSKTAMCNVLGCSKQSVSQIVNSLIPKGVIEYKASGGKLWITKRGVSYLEHISSYRYNKWLKSTCRVCYKSYRTFQSSPKMYCSSECQQKDHQRYLDSIKAHTEPSVTHV